MGVLLTGILLYFLVRWWQRQNQKGLVDASTSTTNAEIKPPLVTRRYKKPELADEDARQELDAAERGKAELAGEHARMELDAL